MPKTARRTADAIEILGAIVAGDTELEELVAEETVNAEVAALIRDARARAGVTQAELAGLVRTTQSVIARLEDADYRGHSLTMLQRIAGALGQRVEVRLSKPRRSVRRRAAG